LLAVRVVGSLAEPAHLDAPIGPMELPAGDFDFIAFASEAWSSSATFRFSPSEGTEALQ
jgi:hypothetical protein